MTSVSAVALTVILAVLASSALAVGNPPAQPVDTRQAASPPAVTDPATTTPDTADSPAPPTVTLPVIPVPTPVIVPVPGTQVRTMLIKHVRAKLVPTRKSVWHLQSLMGLRLTPGGNVWSLGSPQAGQNRLSAWKKREHKLLLAARQRINSLTAETNHMLRVMGEGPARMLSLSGGIAEHLAQVIRTHQQTKRRYTNPPDYSALMCIHGGEGSWNDTRNPKYDGGLQMDLGFQSHYGGWLLKTKGRAYNWTPLEQIWTAEKAIHSGRGFYPWPNTARYCGLI